MNKHEKLPYKNSFVKESDKVVKEFIAKITSSQQTCPYKGYRLENGRIVLDKKPKKKDDKAVRYNEGKPMYSLVPVELEEAAARSFTEGQEKYPKNNHFKPMNWETPYNSLMRHMKAWASGEDLDSDCTEGWDITHLERAASNLAMLLRNVKNNPEGDFRWEDE